MAVVATGAATTALAQAKPPPRTFVLVHGAWHGAWAWRRLEEVLRAHGHDVLAVTLTGLAERAHLLTKDVNLTTHVTDVARVIEVEELAHVTLVGHSYAGMVIPAAAARVASRIARLVYLDAFVPEPGQSMLGLMNSKFSESWRAKAKAVGEGFKVPPMLDAKAMGITDEAEAKWVDSKLTPHPLATLEEKVQYDAAALAPIAKTYVWCSKYPGFKPTAERVRAAGWDVKELEAGHDAMIVAPAELAALLEALR